MSFVLSILNVSYCYRSYQYKDICFLFVCITHSCLRTATVTSCGSGRMSLQRQVTKQGYTTRGDTYSLMVFVCFFWLHTTAALCSTGAPPPRPLFKCPLSNLPNSVLRGRLRSSHQVLDSQQWSLTCRVSV